ncbi:MAG: HlyD family efflux transporter periplasmic adaptor subunit, partial [Planctomycetota bacterium]|nr:HlyD family efflux transporter periplasmic adaptor subunit [Planctomycetota bacterium]
GEKVAAAATLLTLSAPGKLRVVLDVPEAKLAWLTPGMKATISPVAWPELKLTGRCAAPAPTGKGGADQSFKLPVDLESPPDARLSAGMKANVRIDAGTVENVLVLPVAAVSSGVVKVRGKDGKPQEKDVTVGRTDGTVVEIRDGLSEGDEVLAAGSK